MSAPRISSAALLGGLIGWALSLAPGQLPRAAMVSAVVGTVLMLLGMGLGAVGARLGRRRVASSELVSAVTVAAAAAIVGALWWQTRVADSVGVPTPGPVWVAATAGVPLTVGLALVSLPGRVWAVGALLTALVAGPAAQARAAAPDVPADPALSYSVLDSTSDVDARARALVDEWAQKPRTDAVVVIVPTGSGWVDASAVEGFRRHFDDDVAFLAMQYSDVPSWQAYVRSPAAASDSAIAVVRALDRRISTSPDRPDVYLFGQSLGAVGADAARAWAEDHAVAIDGTVLSGPPAGTIESLPACEPRVVLVNATDPVADFDTSLTWHAPDNADGTTTVGAPRQQLPWVPGLSLIGTALDLAVSLDGPVGTGHHYGIEQGLAVGELPRGCQTIGPRAAS
ncbi:alpha/beta-hydrolase family protein [Gordonia sp. MMO-8]|uniref:alpha/beta-hydrolase family protein n=1 Tax=Gordonia sp. MMO-8 TaxID=3127886 RepID=UPI0030170AC9